MMARTSHPQPSAEPLTARRRGPRPWLGLAAVAAAAALALVFAAYLSPHMVADLANRLWSCF